ncbi:EAL domain-containing protein [Deinococcus sp. A31D244]|uniref:bifunctional diguanylate cyclase/phosphodiesterase n=1 Tax=Deinococcus sp. A31D244 TaxID=3397675 RepID=UPI0039E1E8F9
MRGSALRGDPLSAPNSAGGPPSRLATLAGLSHAEAARLAVDPAGTLQYVEAGAQQILEVDLTAGTSLASVFPGNAAWQQATSALLAGTVAGVHDLPLPGRGTVQVDSVPPPAPGDLPADAPGDGNLRWFSVRHAGLSRLPGRLPDLLLRMYAAPDMDSALETVLSTLQEDVYGILMSLHDPQDDTLVLRYRVNFDPATLTPYARVPVTSDLPAAEVFRSGQVMTLTREECRRYPGLQLAPLTQRIVMLPLHTATRRVGVMMLSLRHARVLEPGVITYLHLLAQHCAAAAERAQLFSEVRRAEQQYRTLVEASHSLVWETDADFRVHTRLPDWEAFSGQTFAEYRGMGYLQALPPDSRERYLRVCEQARHDRQPLRFELAARTAAGEVVQCLVQAAPILDDDGNVLSWVGTMNDVTAERLLLRRQSITQQVLQQLGSASQPAQTYDVVLRAAMAATDGRSGVLVARYDNEAAAVVSSAQWPFPELNPQLLTHLNDSEWEWTLQQTGPVWLREPAPTPPGPHGPQGDQPAVLLIPLRADGSFRAVLALDQRDRDLTPDQLDHLRWIQPHLGQAAQRALLLQTLQRREEQSRAILEAVEEALVLCLPDGTPLQANRTTLESVGLTDLTGLPSLTDPIWALRSMSGELLDVREYPISQAAQTGQTIRNAQATYRLTNGEQRVVIMNAVPWSENGDLRGVIVTTRDITEAHRLRLALEQQAQQDELTGLGNRRAFNQALQQLTQAGQGGGIMLLDIDRFKHVNDTHGHHTGDALLNVTAGRLRTLIPPPQVVTRLAGDEFGVVLTGHTGTQAAALAGALLNALQQPVILNGVHLYPRISLGLSVHEDAGGSVSEWFKEVDLALHEAKRQGRARWCPYTPDLAQRHARLAAIEERLRTALDTRSLQVHYQPVARAGQTCWQRFEALARWHDPQLGSVSPAEFIPVAETSGLISELGRQIMKRALRQAAVWSQQTRQRVTMHVNVSAGQLQAGDLPAQVRAALQETGCVPSQLVVELTESEAVVATPPVIRQLNALRTMGVRIALDDFGTGHSSLSVLEQLPVDSIKIDRSFVRNIDVTQRRQALLGAILKMTAELETELVVEGVETQNEHSVLDRLGVEFMQGYLLCRPHEAARFQVAADRSGLILTPPES